MDTLGGNLNLVVLHDLVSESVVGNVEDSDHLSLAVCKLLDPLVTNRGNLNLITNFLEGILNPVDIFLKDVDDNLSVWDVPLK